ncbi:MAG: MBL fold metallo-hydrolase [Gemmatimonadetes bacterium]|nr:MAG: MBL fold metallo-hydrolase [Gemmatimonadota bacterium]
MMKIKVWGARGDIVAPGPETVKYGGNTTCIEVLSSTGERLILDAGIGITRLGLHLIPPKDTTEPKDFHILLSHSHIDHIQGFVFFPPIFSPHSVIYLYCPQGSHRTLSSVIRGLFATQYSPLEDVSNLPSKIQFIEETSALIHIPPFEVEQIRVDHPGDCYAYLIKEGETAILFATDHEARDNEINKNLIEKGKNVNLLLHDAQLTPAEYQQKIGWGHSSYPNAVENARQMGAKKLMLISHDPDRTDNEMDQIVMDANRLANGEFEVVAAMEGHVYKV